MAEALVAYVALLTRDARDAFERERDRYYHGRVMKDKPIVPAILGVPSA